MKNIISILFLQLALLFLITGCSKDKQSNLKEKLWYKQPASVWEEALPLGNGRLGAMIHGNPGIELLQLNEESIWAGVPENPYPEDVRSKYSRFRELNLERKFDEAMKYAMENLVAKPTSFRSYEPLGNLFLQLGHENIKNYSRSLDLETGIAKVEYGTSDAKICSETFISVEYDAIIYQIKSSGNQPLDCIISFNREKDIKTRIDKNMIMQIEGQIYDDENGYDDNPGGSGKGGYHMKFHAQVAVKPGKGEVGAEGNQLRVKNTDEFTVVITAATDYNPDSMNFDRSIDPERLTSKIIERAIETPYKQIRKQHIDQHSSLYNRVELNLTDLTTDTIPTDKRIQNITPGSSDLYLQQLLFQYGRYLLIASSGGRAVLPANLQGIWNHKMWAPWESDFHMDINLQMNYWPAEVCNLSETVDPLTNWFINLSERGKATARKFIGSDGWVAHLVSNPFGRTDPSGSSAYSQIVNGVCFPLAGAWMSLTLWRHYEFTLDKNYLDKKAYPVIRGASRYILDFLVEDKDGQLITVPSYSPENSYIDPVTGKPMRNTVASAIDIQIIRDVFSACLQSEKILERNELSDEIESALKKLPPIKVGSNGTIQEWMEDYEEAEINHRHISHLFALYPSSQINPSTPELFRAARKSIERRFSNGGTSQTGWSNAWIINFYARLLDGDNALHHINELLRKHTYPNLFDSLYDLDMFQIDGNFGVTAGIAEMLLQSQEKGVIRILPALPAAWENGYVKGLKARGNYQVDLAWKEGILDNGKIRASAGGEFELIYKDVRVRVKLAEGEEYNIDGKIFRN